MDNETDQVGDCSELLSSISVELSYVFAVINIVVGFVALTGNLLVFILISKTNSLRNRSMCCIMSLAITDFLVGVILEPMHIMQFLFQNFSENCAFNLIRRGFSVILIGASISSIAFISYDRYIHLSKTKNYTQNMTLRKITLLLFMVWFIPIVMPLIRVLGNDETVYGTMILFYSPSNFIIMMVCYICIIKIVKAKEQKLLRHNEFGRRRTMRGTRYHVQAAKVVLIIIICFFVTTMPISIYMGVSGIQLIMSKEIVGFSGQTRETLYAFAMTSAMVGSALNPIIYYARNPGFKERLKEMLMNRCPCMFSSQALSQGSPQTSSRISSSYESQSEQETADCTPYVREEQSSEQSLHIKKTFCKRTLGIAYKECLTFAKGAMRNMPYLYSTSPLNMPPVNFTVTKQA